MNHSSFWSDKYMCIDSKLLIIDTINYMLDLHKPDFPNTACVGITYKERAGFAEIYPKVIRKDGQITDFSLSLDDKNNIAIMALNKIIDSIHDSKDTNVLYEIAQDALSKLKWR